MTGCVVETPPHSPSQVTETLVVLLQDPQPDIRRTAAQSLGKIGSPEAIPALISALDDQDEEVRHWSAWALGMTSETLPQHAVVGLIQKLSDSSPHVRQAASLALGRTSSPQELMKVLEEAYPISTPQTQQAIIQTLTHFEFPFSYSLFLKALKSPDAFTRQAGIAGIGELGDRRGIKMLRTHLLEDPNVGVRAEAAFRLGKLGGPADLTVLRKAKNTDPTPQVHFWSSWALDQIQEPT